ncbi:alpha/beta hydrolase [Rhodococcus sp. NPDC058521]|uniref:alpha/beta hydrolase n=1 Tax=Rhodococcus sp. NPDC058521 TaxID=3346536 RepID=UPI00365455AE
MIREWDVVVLEQLEESLSGRLTTVTDVQQRIVEIGRLPSWSDTAAEAARRSFQLTSDRLTDEAATIGAVRECAHESAAALRHVKAELSELTNFASTNGFDVADSGHVTDVTDHPRHPAEEAAERETARAELEAGVRALLRQAADIDADAAAILARAAAGEIDAGNAKTTGEANARGAEQGELTAPMPPRDASHTENREYWEALPEAQRAEILAERPEWVGNRDGIPAGVRHEANANRIDDERSRLEAERDRLRAELDANLFGGTFSNKDAELWYTEQKLKDLDTLEQIVEKNPDGKLMLLDMTSGERSMAAFALGDPDTADHIAVTTPGINTTIESLEGMTSEGKALKTETEQQLHNAGRGNETVATVAWLGYEPPTTTGPGNFRVPFTDQAIGRGWLVDSWQSDRAAAGAPKLASFYEGLDVASQTPDPHLTALGHSYGSYTQALALQDPSPGQPVDDAVFYGSPGINANDESDLGLKDGHGFVMRTPDDPISYVDGFGKLGPDPVQTDLEQLSTREATTKDGVLREDSNGHSEYPRSSANGELRTSGYNMAVIIAGLPDLAVR